MYLKEKYFHMIKLLLSIHRRDYTSSANIEDVRISYTKNFNDYIFTIIINTPQISNISAYREFLNINQIYPCKKINANIIFREKTEQNFYSLLITKNYNIICRKYKLLYIDECTNTFLVNNTARQLYEPRNGWTKIFDKPISIPFNNFTKKDIIYNILRKECYISL